MSTTIMSSFSMSVPIKFEYTVWFYLFNFWQAEERLAMVEEQRKMEEERQKMQKENEKRIKEEQKKILGKNNSRPKLSFSFKTWYIWAFSYCQLRYLYLNFDLRSTINRFLQLNPFFWNFTFNKFIIFIKRDPSCL